MTTANLFTHSATAQSQAALGANTDGTHQTEGQALYQQASQSSQPEAVVKRQFEQRNRDQQTQLANEFIESAGREGINDLAATPDGQHALAVVYEHADSDTRQFMREVHEEQGNTAVDYTPAEGLTDKESEVMIGLAQMTLDLVGIVDPTPISDVSSAALSITQGDWLGVFISGLSIVPYVGDLAKLGKLGKWAETVSKAVDLAINNAEYAKKVEPLLKEIGEAIGNIPESAMKSLPEEMQKSLKEIKQKIDKLISPAVDTPKNFGAGAAGDNKLSSIGGNKASEVDAGNSANSLSDATVRSGVVGPDNMSAASSSANATRLEGQLISEEVSQGHAFEKHVVERGEFSPLGIRTREQFQNHIEGIVSNPEIPRRYAADGTTYYLDESTRTIVVQGQRGEATAFRPDYGVGWDNYLELQVPRNTQPPAYNPVPSGRTF